MSQNTRPAALPSILVAGFLATATSVEATTVLAIRYGGGILIAADSLRIGTTDKNETVALRVCKVRNYGDLVYTATGRYQPPAISPDALAANLLPQRGSESIRHRIARFAEEAKASFELYDSGARSDGVVFAYALGFFEAGDPVLLTQRFFSVGGQLVVERPKEIEHNTLFAAGQTDSLQHPQLAGRTLQSEQYPALFDEIVRLQARLTPGAVGKPADMVQLTASGSKWLQRKGDCPTRE